MSLPLFAYVCPKEDASDLVTFTGSGIVVEVLPSGQVVLETVLGAQETVPADQLTIIPNPPDWAVTRKAEIQDELGGWQLQAFVDHPAAVPA